MEKLCHITELFKWIDPLKKFSSFTFEELDKFEDIRADHCAKDKIVQIENEFYIYAGMTEAYISENIPNAIRFEKRKKLIKRLQQ